MVTLYEKLNRKEMGVFLDALRSLKGSHIDPTSTPPSHDPEDWTEIPAKTSEDFPKQCIAIVQGGSLLLRNNFTREGFRVNILPRGKELRKERIKTPEYGVDFDDDNLDLLSNIVGSIAWLVYLYEEGDHESIVSYVERNFDEYTKVIKRLRSAVKRYGVPETVEKLVTYCLDFVDSLW